MKLSVDNTICKLAKISNNTLQMGSGMFVPEFTIPVSGLMLSAEQLNDTMGDSLTWRSWYNHCPPALPKPCDWWAHSKGEFPIPDEFEGDWLLLHVSGDRVLEFEADEPQEKGKKTPAFRISKVVLKPMHGGNTEVRFHLHVRPGIGKENLILQEHQHSEVRLSFSQTKPTAQSGQAQLQLDAPTEDAKLAPLPNTTTTGAVEGSRTEESQGAESEAVLQSAKSAGPVSEAPRDTGTQPENGPTRDGEPTRVGGIEEAELSPPPPSGVEAARLLTERRNDDLQEFEKGLTEEIQGHKKRPFGVIDGTASKRRAQ